MPLLCQVERAYYCLTSIDYFLKTYTCVEIRILVVEFPKCVNMLTSTVNVLTVNRVLNVVKSQFLHASN